MAIRKPRWAARGSQPPSPFEDSSLEAFAAGVRAAIDGIAERRGIDPSLDPEVVVARLRERADKLRPASSEADSITGDIGSYRRGWDLLRALQSLEDPAAPDVLALNAVQGKGRPPQSMALALGRQGWDVSGPLFVSLTNPNDPVEHQVALASRAVHDFGAPGDSGRLVVGAAGGTPEAASTSFADTWPALTGLADAGAPFIVQTPDASIGVLAAALKRTGGRLPDLLVHVGDSPASLDPIPTKSVPRDHQFAKRLHVPEVRSQLLRMADRARQEREYLQLMRGEVLPTLVKNLDTFRDRYDTSDEFVALMRALAHDDGLRVNGRFLNPLLLDDQDGRNVLGKGPRFVRSKAPWSTVTLGGPVSLADRVRLIVANDPNYPLETALEDLTTAHRDEIDQGTLGVAVLCSGAPVVRDTVTAATDQLRAFNTSVEVQEWGTVPETISRVAKKGVAASGARSAADQLKGALKKRLGPPKTGL